MRVADVMTTVLITVQEDENIQSAAQKMVDHNISVLPVLNHANELVGVVTESDFVGKKANIPHAMASIKTLLGQNFYFADVEEIFVRAKDRQVKEVMSNSVRSAPSQTTLTELVNMMIKTGLKRIPIVDENKLVGIVTRRDLLKAFAQS